MRQTLNRRPPCNRRPPWPADLPKEASLSYWIQDIKDAVGKRKEKEREEMNDPLWTKFDEVCWWVAYITICAFAGYALGAAIVKVWRARHGL